MIKNIMEHKYLFHQGSNYRSYEMFGAHRLKEGGYIFRTWAPRAVSISLVGEFNDWDLSAHMMKRLEDDDSIWEVTCKEAKAGQLYKFAVKNDRGEIHYKADPYAFESESALADSGSQRASRIFDIEKPYSWHDDEWLKK